MKVQRQGFTILEILVAASIMTGLIVVVLSLTSTVLTSWNRSADALARERQARLAMDYLVRDLQSLQVRVNQGRDMPAWAAFEGPPEASAFGTMPMTLRFFAATDDFTMNTPGDLAAVSYWIGTDDVNGDGQPTSNLYRGVETPETAFRDFILPAAAVQDWPTANRYQGGPGDATFLLGGVIDLQVSPIFALGSGRWEALPTAARGRFPYTNRQVTPTEVYRKPVAVEVTLSVLTTEGQRLYASPDHRSTVTDPTTRGPFVLTLHQRVRVP